jgi:hypothetical protein
MGESTLDEGEGLAGSLPQHRSGVGGIRFVDRHERSVEPHHLGLSGISVRRKA